MGRDCEIMTIFAVVLLQKPAYRWWRIFTSKEPSLFSFTTDRRGNRIIRQNHQ